MLATTNTSSTGPNNNNDGTAVAVRVGAHGLSTLVRGVSLDKHTRCAHYHTELDIVALRFFCCGEFYACYSCHEALAGHKAQTWPASLCQQQNPPPAAAAAAPLSTPLPKVVVCGACGHLMTVSEYQHAGRKQPAHGDATTVESSSDEADSCDPVCPACGSSFNPRCKNHYHLYFETTTA